MTTPLILGENFAVPSSWPPGTWGMVTSIGVTVANLHWKADPKKRNDPDWFSTNTRGMDARTIQREFELDWTVADGKPVFPDYDKGRHGSSEIFRAAPGQPVYAGWDYGLNPACVFMQPTDSGQLRVLRVLNEENCPMVRFGPMVIRTMLELNAEAGYLVPTWPQLEDRARALWESVTAESPKMNMGEAEIAEQQVWRQVFAEAFRGGLEWIHIGDPAGAGRTANDAISGARYLQIHFGISVKSNQKHQVWDTRRNAVSSLLLAGDVAPGQPKFVISGHASCDRLRVGFEGSYAYAESADTGGREVPKKDRFSHPQDCVQYVACVLLPQSSSKPLAAAVAENYSPFADSSASLPQAPKPAPETRWEGLEMEERAAEGQTATALGKPIKPHFAWLQSQMA